MTENVVPETDAPGPQVDLADDAYSLPSRYYIDPEILELEYERIFYRAWNFAGHVSQLKTSGDYITCIVGRERIIVIVMTVARFMHSIMCAVTEDTGCWKGRGTWIQSSVRITRGVTQPTVV